MTEKAIEQSFVRWCKRNGHRAVKLQAASDRGFPDRTVFTRDGRILFIEFKQPGGELRPQQKIWIEFLRRQGHVAEVVDNVADAICIVRGKDD